MKQKETLISKWGAARRARFHWVRSARQSPDALEPRLLTSRASLHTFLDIHQKQRIRWQETDWLLGPLTADSQISALPSIWQVIPLLIKPTRGELSHTTLGNFQDKQTEKRKRKEYRTISFSLLSALRNHTASPGWINYHEAYSFTIYQVQN